MRSADRIRTVIPVMLILFFVIGFFCLIVYRGSNYKEPEEKTIEFHEPDWDDYILFRDDIVTILRREMFDDTIELVSPESFAYDPLPYTGISLRELNRTALGKMSRIVKKNGNIECYYDKRTKEGETVTVLQAIIKHKGSRDMRADYYVYVLRDTRYWHDDMLVIPMFDEAVAEKYPYWAEHTADLEKGDGSGLGEGYSYYYYSYPIRSVEQKYGGSSNYSSSGSLSDKGDWYNASDYEDPDDFYYMNEEDFDDYEDAADYWNEHND